MRPLIQPSLSVLLAVLVGCGTTTEPGSGNGPDGAPSWCGVAQAERVACDGVLPTRFDASTTIDKGCYVAAQTPGLADGVTLTLAPGVTILFASRAGLRLSADQLLVATGTEAEPICLSGQETTRGSWDGLSFDGTSAASELDHVVVEYGGDTITTSDRDAAGIKATADSRGVRLGLRHTTVRESQGWGLWLGGSTELSAFASNVLTKNTLGPANVASRVIGSLDAATTYGGNDRDQLVVNPGSILVAATWATLDVPYYLDGNLDAEAAWTLGAGTTLIVADGALLTISGDDAALIARGTAEQPILFRGATEQRGSWQSLTFDGSNNELNELTYVTVRHAGSTTHDVDGAAVRLISDSSGVQVKLAHSTLEQSEGWGLFLTGSAIVPAFDGNTLTGNGLGPVSVGSTAAHQLLPTSSYTGNDVDRVRVQTDYVPDGASWADLGVPYALTDVLAPHGVWTVEPGVTLIMLATTGRLDMGGDEAALHAAGTAEKPILFTSDAQTAGSWQGVLFDGSLNPANVLEHVTIEYAGSAPVQYPGAVFATSDSHGVRVAVTNCTIRHNAAFGLWVGMYAQVNADVESANNFADNGSGAVFIQE